MRQLDTENADLDLTTIVTVLTHTPDAAVPTLCQALILLGDGTKNLTVTGGDFEITVTIGGQTLQPSPQIVTFGTEVRATVFTTAFPVPANAEVVVRVKSPNAGDIDVDVTAYLYEVSALQPAVLGRTVGVNASGHVERVTLVDTVTGGGAADVYSCSVDVASDGRTYLFKFFKNNEHVTGGVTTPTIRVKSDDSTTVFGPVAPSAGGTGIFKHVAAVGEALTSGSVYDVTVAAADIGGVPVSCNVVLRA